MNIWHSAGFTPIPMAATDILPNLQTGMINCFDTTPTAALAFQWFALAKHMTNMKWCPLVGATIISTKAWEKIPAKSRPAILKAAKLAAKEFKEDRMKSENNIEVMKKYGLVVHDITDDQYAQWQQLFESVYPQISGSIVPADVMQLAIKYRNEYRAKAKKAEK
jgi:TRAP-type transport system periplasmic protein